MHEVPPDGGRGDQGGPGGGGGPAPSEKAPFLFAGEARPRWRAGSESAARYRELVESDGPSLAADMVKEALELACAETDGAAMRPRVEGVCWPCRETGDAHFGRFAGLPGSRMGGVCAHARFPIPSGRVEGTNNMTKTVRGRAYGLPDDGYFFLKVIDASHRKDRW